MEYFIEPVTLDILTEVLSVAALNPAVILLFLVIIADIVTGYAKNAIYKTANSSGGIKGLIKHTTVLFIALIISFIGYLLQGKYAVYSADIIIFLFAVEYTKSVFENFGVMGFKYPKMLTAKVEKEIEEKLKLKTEAQELKKGRLDE